MFLGQDLLKRMKLNYDTTTETTGGAGASNTGENSGTQSNSEANETIKNLKAQIEKITNDTNKEINSLKSQLGHANKQIEDYQKNGKSAEELAKMEKEKLEQELAEAKKQLNLTALLTKKSELVAQLKISPQFADLVQITPDMTLEKLETAVKDVAAKEKEFTTEFLKKNSITNGGFNSKDKKKDEKDFVDRMIEKSKNNETDLTKF